MVANRLVIQYRSRITVYKADDGGFSTAWRWRNRILELSALASLNRAAEMHACDRWTTYWCNKLSIARAATMRRIIRLSAAAVAATRHSNGGSRTSPSKRRSSSLSPSLIHSCAAAAALHSSSVDCVNHACSNTVVACVLACTQSWAVRPVLFFWKFHWKDLEK